jgi:hypothetical protein
MEEDYKEKIEFSGLERKKKVLASLRDLHQPLNMELIENEQKKYEEIINQNKEQRKQEMLQKLKENEQSYDYKKFHSSYMERVIENELLQKEKLVENEERRKEYQNKMREYDEVIKKKYKPLTSKRKHQELERVIY